MGSVLVSQMSGNRNGAKDFSHKKKLRNYKSRELDKIPKTQVIKAKINNFKYIKLKSLCIANDQKIKKAT